VAAWCAAAGQAQYAALAPRVFDCEGTDPQARDIIGRALQALQALADAADPTAALPLVLTGSVALRLADRFSPSLLARRAAAQGDATSGAIELARRACAHRPAP
jgi:glucosamine kinase